MAGLPNSVSSLPSNDGISFLEKASHRRLGNVSQAEAEVALRRTIKFSGKDMGEADLLTAARSTLGYPYLMQLVRYHLWEFSADRNTISFDDVHDGVLIARREFEGCVLELTRRRGVVGVDLPLPKDYVARALVE
ncbi:MAG: hypothetical protein IKF78_04805 [Atopobiaceae bacterium]|nr:hypothetical protein [Atopobiaceae bacterium]